MPVIGFTEWAPDLPSYAGQALSGGAVHLLDARGVYAVEGGYIATNKPGGTNYGTLSSETPLDLISFFGDGTDFLLVAPTNEKIYKIENEAFTDVSEASITYGASQPEGWGSAQFGLRAILTNIVDGPQYFDIGTSSAFADLPGSPPKAKRVAQVRDFVMLGNLDEGGTVNERRVRWSGFNDSESWTVDPDGTQADFQDLPSQFGEVQAIVGGEFATIIQERAITRATYVGPPAIFQFDQVEEGRGAKVAKSVIKIGGVIYYYAEDGFYAFDGQSSRAIGEGRVNKWIADRIDDVTAQYCRVSHDRVRGVVTWSWPSAVISSAPNAAGAVATGALALMYSYRQNKWSYDTLENEEWLFSTGVTDDILLDELNAPLDYYDGTLDSAIYDVITVQTVALVSEDNDWVLYRLGGPQSEVRMETARFSFMPNRFAFVNEGYVLGNIGAVTGATLDVVTTDNYPSRALADGSGDQTATANTQADGYFGVVARGKFFGVTLTLPETARDAIPTFDDVAVIQGVDLEYTPTGKFG